MPEILNLIGDDERPVVCETQVAGDIWRTIEVAQKLGCIGSVVGEPGVGKTTAARAYAERVRRARYCVMDPVHDTMNAMLSLLCGAVCQWSPPCSTLELYEVLCNAVCDDRVKVLLVDEAQHVNARNLDVLRGIHDKTGVPLVLLGNATLGSRFNTTRAAAFAQLSSRIGSKLYIKACPEADLHAFARHYGAHEPKAITFLGKWAADKPGLRQAEMLLRLGRELACDGDIKLTHLKQAASIIGETR
ncbi:MAG: AAA family ATPase [Rhodospirillales bacterium]|nr:AAA family ATPase [Rhodospirillales bacterium]